jgi:DNA repair protein RecO (recombination protein O)
MLQVEAAPAYVLHHRPYRETSLLLELLVFGLGRVGAIARGVRGPKSAARRAILQPLQPLNVSLQRRGELHTLLLAEPASQRLAARGDALLAALYVNELCQRLLPRDEPVDAFFLRYAACMSALVDGQGTSDALRRIELDLLEASGYALPLEADARGSTIEAEGYYLFSSEQALEPVAAAHPGAVAGTALIALREGLPVDAAQQAAVRRLLREALRLRLGPRPLRCWGLLDELAALGGRGGEALAPGTPVTE